MKKYFWGKAESGSSSFETNAEVNAQYVSLYKALDEMFGLNEDDDPDHPLSPKSDKKD
ncbi:hypothetical protein [uncultured Desulfobacter sp.]|uniref:hypothetical protein n=1 Tax=uncultured Desulfobacter sp. TaxID=240139 RepID=UPI002AA6BCA8|nr:hypothetical protein [uncultured Desulfobacter sp.]